MIASRAVKQPAVLGSTSTPAASSTSRIEPAGGGVEPAQRDRAQLRASTPASASASSSWLAKPPVPRISRELNSRPAIASTIAHLISLPGPRPRPRLERPVAQLRVGPRAPANDLAVDRDGHPAALRRARQELDHVGDGGARRQLALLAVDDHLARSRVHWHRPRSGRRERRGELAAAAPRSARAARSSAVIGASRIP